MKIIIIKLSKKKIEKMEHVELIFLIAFGFFFFENNITTADINIYCSHIFKFNNSVFFE
jgi:hypothetical protein